MDDQVGTHGAGQARGPDRDRGRSARRHRGDAPGAPRHEGREIQDVMSNNNRRNGRGGTGDERSGADGAAGTGARGGSGCRAWAGSRRGAGLASLGGGLAGRPAWAQGQPKRGGTLKVATVDKPVNMDPGFAQLYSSLQIYQNVYNKLRLRRRVGPVRSRACEVLEAGERQDLALRPRRQRRLPQRRAHHRRRTSSSRSPGCSTPRTSCPCACSSRRSRAWRRSAAPGALQPEPSRSARSSPCSSQATEIVNEKALAGEGPEALPHRHRPLQVRRVGEGRPRHARALGQVLPAGPALHRPHHLLRARRRHGPAHRAADRALQLDPDRAAPAHPRAGARRAT